MAIREDPGRHGPLLVVTLLSVAVQGTVAPGDLQQVIVTALGAAILLLAFRAAEFPRWAVGAAAALATVIIALSIVRATAGGIGDGSARADRFGSMRSSGCSPSTCCSACSSGSSTARSTGSATSPSSPAPRRPPS